MNTLKYVGQVLSSIIYTPIYTGVMYLLIVFPFMWIVTLSFWKMVIAVIVLGGIIEGVVMLLQTLGILPYSWIVKNNRVALFISIALCVLLSLYNVYALWKALIGFGAFGIISAIILSLMILQFVFGSITGMLSFYDE